MPEVSTKVDLCRGHDACPPRPFSTFSPNVLAEGFEVTRDGDHLHSHGCSKHPPHGATVTRGYATVKVNGHPIAYVGASVGCPSGVVNTGRPSVLVGEGRHLAGALGRGNAATMRPGATGGGSRIIPAAEVEERRRRKLTPTETTCRDKPLYQQAYHKSCTVSSMRMIINQRTGRNVSEADVATTAKKLEVVDRASGQSYGQVYQPFIGSTNEGTAAVLAEHGVEAYVVDTPAVVTPDHINRVTANGTQPAIMGISLDGVSHSVVIDGMDAQGNVLMRDPWPTGKEGCRKIPLQEFQTIVKPDIPTTVVGEAPPGAPPRPWIVRPKEPS